MSEENQIHDYQITSCQRCFGSGKKLNNKKCHVCDGSGMGLWFFGYYFYWGVNINGKERFLDSLRKKIFILINIFAIAVIILGLGSFIYELYTLGFANIFSMVFWTKSSMGNLGLWISIFALLFIYYRFTHHKEVQVKVIERKFQYSDQESYNIDIEKSINKKKKVEISQAFTPTAKETLYEAYRLAKDLGSSQVRPLHLFSVLPGFNQVAIMFGRLGIKGSKLQNKLAKALAYIPKESKIDPLMSTELNKVLLESYMQAYNAGLKKVSESDLLLSVIQSDDEINNRDLIQEILEELEVDNNKIKNVVEWIRIKQKLYEKYKNFHSLARFKPKGNVNRAMTSIATKTLNAYSTDLTKLAAYEYLMPCIGRDKEIREIFRIIEGTGKSVLLVGHNGIGKKTIIEGIAQLMVTEDVPDIIEDKRLVSLNIPRLVGGVSPAEAQNRLLNVMDEAIFSGNIVLGIKNIEGMVGITVGGQSSLDLSHFFSDSLNSKRMFALATTDPQSYTKYIEGTNLGDSFSVIHIKEMDLDSAIQVLELKTGTIENKNNIYFSYTALEKAVHLSARYIHNKYLPEKAIDIIEEAAVFVKNSKRIDKIVTGEDIAQIISNRTNIPFTSISEEESQKLLDLEQIMHERIVGQDKAVKVVAESLKRARTELRDKNRPIANLMFLGPTGVGKTELAKTLSEIYFGSEKKMLRFDMSEYQEKSSIERLIGTLSEPGHLTEAVRKNPFSLILFDELEKAHPDILNIFLQMMDDGRLTDGRGYTVDFSNAIIITTSNAGTSYIQDEIEKGTKVEIITESLMRNKLKEYYRPEFLNRFDNIVVFKPLVYDEIIKITKLLINKVRERLEQKGIHFECTEEAIIELAELGYDPQFGARPLRRVIQEKVDTALADFILLGKISKRDIVVYDAGGEIHIEKAKSL